MRGAGYGVRVAADLGKVTANDNHVQRHKAHNDRILSAKSLAKDTVRTEHDIQNDAPLGASNHGHLIG